MTQLALGLFQLTMFPANAVNVYLMGDVLVDAGTRFDRRRILRELRGRDVRAHALTHAHPDHQGSSHAVCEALGIPLWCGAADAPAVENSSLIVARQPDRLINRVMGRLRGPSHPVARRLREGDEVGDFTVLDVPGHSAGHVAYWRESDRVLILGDVLTNMNLLTMSEGLHTPPEMFTPDPARNRESARKLAGLKPSLVCFGHGKPLRDPEKFAAFVNSLPA